MDVCDLMNRTADHIEQYPKLFDFDQGGVTDPRLPHCMLARMGQLAGIGRGFGCPAVAGEILKSTANQFYGQIAAAQGMTWDGYISRGAMTDPARIVPAMRQVAERYRGIPVSIREIFRSENSAGMCWLTEGARIRYECTT